MKKKKILDTEDCKSLIKMINSEDDESAYVAYKILENCDIKNNITQILIVFKIGSVTYNIIKQEAPKLHKKVKSLLPENNNDCDVRWETIYKCTHKIGRAHV